MGARSSVHSLEALKLNGDLSQEPPADAQPRQYVPVCGMFFVRL